MKIEILKTDAKNIYQLAADIVMDVGTNRFKLSAKTQRAVFGEVIFGRKDIRLLDNGKWRIHMSVSFGQDEHIQDLDWDMPSNAFFAYGKTWNKRW